MLAFSKVDLLAIFRNWLNSFFDREPDPSAMLLDIDMPAPRSCSAKRYNFLLSRSSAISKSSSAISMAICHISKSWNLNLTMVTNRRAQSAESMARSAGRRAQSAESMAQRAERRAQSVWRRAQSAWRRAEPGEATAYSLSILNFGCPRF